MLRLKRIGLKTYDENVAFLSAQCRIYKPEAFTTLNKVEITAADGRRIMASLNIVENGDMLGPENLGLSIPAFHRLGTPEGTEVSLTLATPPRSLDSVRRKIGGEVLSDAELDAVVRDIAAHRYSKSETVAFVVACAAFMTTDEVLGLTRAMAAAGDHLVWASPSAPFPMLADKHCIGGLPGNRTSMIIVPIVAAYGLPIPKTSSRAITSPAGTADTMEVLANVDVTTERMKEIVAANKGCLTWGGHVNLSPADDIMITVERPLAIDTPEQMVASILSKKLAAGATHLLIDIPVGATAKVRTATDAARLRKLFEYVGGALGLHMTVIITDGSQPVGRGIGPVLEARDVMSVLRNEPGAPQDLKERAILLAGHILDFDPALRGGEGQVTARRILADGRALACMERIMTAQGPPPHPATLGHLVKNIEATASGTVVAIDCFRLARIARLAGAPTSKGAGIDLLKKVGDAVKRGEPMYRIHAAVETDYSFASDMALEAHGYTIV
ncbi:MAG: thymidine phosphorylase family protein [Rhodospirillaceae bacterium]|nr:MAG: thymidine phosphorylase family protein [Rhodospirillaceae bacterium]